MNTNQSSREQNQAPQRQQDKKMNKIPENKDNLDSREGEEQLTKGDDVTHNKKEKHNKPDQDLKN